MLPVTCFFKSFRNSNRAHDGVRHEDKVDKRKGGLFGVPQAFLRDIVSPGKDTLNAYMTVFLAGFLRDLDKIVKGMFKDVSYKDGLIKCSSTAIYVTELHEEHIIFSRCGNKTDLNQQIYM